MPHLTSTSKIFIIDFNDSFTFNVASEIYKLNSNIEVINFNVFSLTFLKNIELQFDLIGIVLGPGPGHPNDYSDLKVVIDYLLYNPKKYKILGICLGHQMIATSLNYEIVDCNSKIHGEAINVVFKKHKLKVQRYNSLVPRSKGENIECFVDFNEVLILSGDNFLSFQFHPESIGTEDPHFFFKNYLKMLGK